MLSKQTKLLHLEKLGLEFNPFPVVPDAHNYFNTDRMYTAIYEIMHCIEARKGFILISGDVGLGKTTLSQLLLLKLADKNVNTALVLNTFLQSVSLIKAINKDFNIKVDSINIEDQLDALNEFLLEQYAQNKNCVIVIDDAQQLNIESLELIRQLSNLETNQNKLVQIILVAQGEIIDTLNRTDLRQLKSRIALNVEIKPLTLNEVHQYIKFRLFRAGSSGQIKVSDKATQQLHKLTNGRPRLINLVLDRCLYVVAAFGNNTIDKNLVNQAFDDISLDSVQEKKTGSSVRKMAPVLILVSLVCFLIWNNDWINHAKVMFHSFQDTNQFDKVTSEKSKIVLAKLKQTPSKVPVNETILMVSEANISSGFANIKNQTNETSKANQTLVQASEFLKQFDLESLEIIFNESIVSNDFRKLSRQLKQTSNYKLLLSTVKFNDVTEFQVLNKIWNLNNLNSDNKWLTFWKPKISLEAFYQGYYSADIFELQTSLKNIGLYNYTVDGIAGTRTIKAIANLQLSLGINPSGFPDDVTLYQLQYFNDLELKKENTEETDKFKINNKTELYAVDHSIISEKSNNK